MHEDSVIVSGIQPTGSLHLGNYAGAISQWVRLQEKEGKKFFFIADLHALTERVEATISQLSFELTCHLLAAGLDPKKVTLFRQSDVTGHTELAWYLSTVVPVSRLELMTQYKDKSNKKEAGNEKVNAGLLYYPILQAADILLYRGTHIPIGKDQVQHIELARNIVEWFRVRYCSDYFKAPNAMLSEESFQKILSLKDPTKKMSKSDGGDGCIYLSDTTEVVEKKIRAAVTDSGQGNVSPGVSNLITLISLCGNSPLADALRADAIDGTLRYSNLKEKTSNTVNEFLSRHQKAYSLWASRPDEVNEILHTGARVATDVANHTLLAIRRIIGLE